MTRIEQIRRESQKLRKTISNLPPIWKFRGRTVVPVDKWRWGDWTKLPDKYLSIMTNPTSTPPDWYSDYLALMRKLEEPEYGNEICWRCAIHQAESAKEEIDRAKKRWDENGGEEAKLKFYSEVGALNRRTFERQDGMRLVEWRLYNELAKANNRTCSVVNYFKCPYGPERTRLVEDGGVAWKIWEHVEWYDNHWNAGHSFTPPLSDMKWYHYGGATIIDVTSLDDIVRSIGDGRLERIIKEHEQYMKEKNYPIWAL
jgi:hypothetical protein